MKNRIVAGILLLSLLGCSRPAKKESATGEEDTYRPVELKYAREFRIKKTEDSSILCIHPGGSEEASDSFLLVNDEVEHPGMTTIRVPCKKIVCLSSTQLTYFLALDEIDPIVAVNSSRYLRHEGMKARIDAGEVVRVGKEGHFNLEMVAALDPDLILVSPFKVGGFDMLRNLGIPLVPMAAYNEQTPLGRAEWVKMIALFVGMEQKADSLFNAIELHYKELRKLASGVDERPEVFSGKMRSGTWYIPGGNSFYAHYFRDAGADYIIKDDKQGAYPVDFETVYSKASECDFWRIIHPEKTGFSLEDLAGQDSRYRDFKAFRMKQVLFCNIREKPYYEQVAMKPDVVLADYIHFFHPEILPEHQPCFYEKLK